MWKVLLLAVGVAVGLGAATVWLANLRFDHAADARIREMLANAAAADQVVTEASLEPLPEPVQRWLRSAGVVGRQVPATVRLRQEGAIRQAPDAPWMRFSADQYYTIDPTSFIWRVSATASPGFFIRGVDELRDGRGAMRMVVLGLFTVVNASGADMDQGAALRYLQEIVWFPFAALARNISWEAVDENSARATLTVGEGSVDGLFTFASDGRVVGFKATRYRSEQPASVLRTWRVPLRDHAAFDGVLVPTSGEATWDLDGGTFTYITAKIVELDYDVPRIFGR
ncbi:MAG: hypothetical protein PHU43_01120 [Candidatus Bipolaricaulis sp.]|nr:hypothetical protein [Candidatus Bipolaricaulis sp.]